MQKILLCILMAICFPVFGATYQVSVEGDKDYSTIDEVNAATFQPGDIISFDAADTFRGWLVCDAGDATGRITYNSYGTGKAKIYGSLNKSSTDDWTDNGGNVWYSATLPRDVGNIIFNNEESVGVKEWALIDLDAQGEFWYDLNNDIVYLYSVGNPGTFYTDIELCIREHLIKGADYVTVDSLEIRYGGAHGVRTDNGTNDFTASRITGRYIGGGDQPENGTGTRYGNGVELWQGSSNIIIERCDFTDCYDASYTTQGHTLTYTVSNIIFRNNISKNAYYDFEYWHSTTNATANGVYYYNNTHIDNGLGWGGVEANRGSTPYPMSFYIGSNTATTSNVEIKNNLIINPAQQCIKFSVAADMAKISFDNNFYDVRSGSLAYLIDTAAGYSYAQISTWRTDSGGDTNSILDYPRCDSNGVPTRGSPALNAGASSAYVTDDYDGTARDSTPDIGAYETGLTRTYVSFSGVTVQ